MLQQPKMEVEQTSEQSEELLSPSSPVQTSPTSPPPPKTKNVVRMISNDIRAHTITIVHNKPTPQYCLLPCPLFHGNKSFQLRFSVHGIVRIVCNCGHPELLVDPQPFKSLTSRDFKRYDGQLDPIVRRLELRENVKFYDPTIDVPPFVPKNMVSFEPKQKFYGNDIFKPCPNEHVGKNVHMISVRGGSNIIVCGCQDKLFYGYSGVYTTKVRDSFSENTVYNYSNPARRNFVAIPQTGFEVI